MINKTKAENETLKQENAQLRKQNQSLNENFKRVSQLNVDLVNDNTNLKQSLDNQIPFTNLSLNGTPYLDTNQINTNMSVMVKQRMGGMMDVINNNVSSPTNPDNTSMDVGIVYMLILERAKYFMSCCQFEGTVEPVVELLYLGLYYGALNGSIALTIDDKGAYLFYPSECTYDKYGNLTHVTGSTFNYYNSANFKSEDVSLPGSKVAMFKFNNEQFGLGVLCGPYLNNIPRILTFILNQGALYNKRFILTSDSTTTHNVNVRQDYARMLRSSSILIFKEPDTVLEPLENPDVDINALWGYLENYTDWGDFHLINMRVKDINTSDKERDIASQQANHSTQNENKNQFVDYFIDKGVHEINNKFHTDFKGHNRMINMDDGIVNQSKTINKLEGGDHE